MLFWVTYQCSPTSNNNFSWKHVPFSCDFGGPCKRTMLLYVIWSLWKSGENGTGFLMDFVSCKGLQRLWSHFTNEAVRDASGRLQGMQTERKHHMKVSGMWQILKSVDCRGNPQGSCPFLTQKEWEVILPIPSYTLTTAEEKELNSLSIKPVMLLIVGEEQAEWSGVSEWSYVHHQLRVIRFPQIVQVHPLLNSIHPYLAPM